MAKVAKGFLEAGGAIDGQLHLDDFAAGKFSPAGRWRRVIAEAGKEEADFGEGEAHFGGEADEQQAVSGGDGVTALAVATVGSGEQAELFVIADGGSVDASAGCEFTDFHVDLLK